MLRVGQGYDAHRLEKGGRMVLGGVEIDYEYGLVGHSDADVLTHAMIDALLGAAALGDIGTRFPDNDSEYAGIDSLILLSRVTELLNREGYVIINTDATVIAQKPKIAPYVPEMRKKLAKTMGINDACVSVKATTEERMGFTGALEGISAQAVVLIKEKRNEL